jgi:DNA polymerase-3 subunit gamma/tau
VVFVFATTEPQKINQFAAPILSRCQRFDFRRIGVADIVSRLRGVLDQEGSGAADEALRIIARKADGGLRDALSILDQVISLTGGDVDAVSVRRVLGLVEEDRYLELLDILRDQRHGDVFVLVEGLIDEGYDLVEFYHGLMDTLRALLRLRLSPDARLDLPEGVRAQLLERAASFQPGDLVRMLASAAELENQGSLRRSPNPRLPIEMLLLRMSFLDRTVDIEELIRALGGAPPRPSGTPHREDAAPPGVEGSSPGGGGPGRRWRGGPPAVSVAEPTDAGGPRPDPRAPAGTAGGASPAEIEPSASAAEGWARWLEAASTVPAGLGPFLRSAAVTEGADGSIEVSMPAGPAVERLGRAAVIDQVRSGLTPYLGRAPVLVIRTGEEPKVGAGRLTEEAVREDTLRALYRQEPRLRRAVEELDLELMD